ncbi:MAG: hypothetical protein WCT28_00340 [Patescibacteria group bacterium]|jgi:hypothetical protein
MLKIPAHRLLVIVSGLIALVTITITIVMNNDDSTNNQIAQSCALVRSVNAAEWSPTTDIPVRPKIPLEILLAEPEKTEKASSPKKAAASKQPAKSAPKKTAQKKRSGKIQEVSFYRARKEETDDKPCSPKNDKINICNEKAKGRNVCGTLLYPQGTVLYVEGLGFCTVHDVTDRNDPVASRRVDWVLPKNLEDQSPEETEGLRIGHPDLMVYVISKPAPKSKAKKAKATKKHKK